MADLIESNYNEWMAKEKSRLDRDIASAERASALDEAARRQRIKDSIAAMDAVNKAQLKQKAEKQARSKQEDAGFAAEWTQRLAELKKEVSWHLQSSLIQFVDRLMVILQEVDEARTRYEQNRQVASFQLRQAEIKARKRAQQKIEELQEAAQVQLSVREQEEVFRQYASEWVEEYKRQGKTTVPLELNLNKRETLETMR